MVGEGIHFQFKELLPAAVAIHAEKTTVPKATGLCRFDSFIRSFTSEILTRTFVVNHFLNGLCGLREVHLPPHSIPRSGKSSLFSLPGLPHVALLTDSCGFPAFSILRRP